MATRIAWADVGALSFSQYIPVRTLMRSATVELYNCQIWGRDLPSGLTDFSTYLIHLLTGDRAVTRNKFLKKFREFATQATWNIQCKGIWGKYEGREFCPITFVHYKITGKIYNRSDFDLAGAELDLTWKDMFDIINAADGLPECSMQLRRDLMKSAGIPVP